MSCSRVFARHPFSPFALVSAPQRSNIFRKSLSSLSSTAAVVVSEGRVRGVGAVPCARVPQPLPSALVVSQRLVWNASYLDEGQAKDLEQRIQDQLKSLDRIQEEIAATCSTTQGAELDRLKSQQRQRVGHLRELLVQYKKVSGEEYHVDRSPTESATGKAR